MVPRDFSGFEIAKVLINKGHFTWVRTTGDQAILKWVHPEGPDVESRTGASRSTTACGSGRSTVLPRTRERGSSMSSASGSTGTANATMGGCGPIQKPNVSGFAEAI